MRILISNDDGIQAKGLESLVKAFCAREHTVVVSAPARQQSGMAHALNVGRPLELIRGEALAEKYGIDPDPVKINDSLSLLWVSCGTLDTRWNGHQAFDADLTRRGIRHTFDSSGYGHQWQFWREQLALFVQQVF